jgi:hypothetical protein
MDSGYSELPAKGPYEVAIGGALITMVEPFPGYEIAYNRWYEDDHYYAGALAMPWMFSGRRWVAPPALRAVRYPESSSVADPITDGRYISLYWITKGRIDDHLAWTVATNKRLRGDGRGFEHRKHVFTSFYEYVGAVNRDSDGPRDIHALDYPYPGMVLEVTDAKSPDERDDLARWLIADYIPAMQASSAVAQTLVFRPKATRPVPTPESRWCTSSTSCPSAAGVNASVTMVGSLRSRRSVNSCSAGRSFRRCRGPIFTPSTELRLHLARQVVRGPRRGEVPTAVATTVELWRPISAHW